MPDATRNFMRSRCAFLPALLLLGACAIPRYWLGDLVHLPVREFSADDSFAAGGRLLAADSRAGVVVSIDVAAADAAILTERAIAFDADSLLEPDGDGFRLTTSSGSRRIAHTGAPTHRFSRRHLVAIGPTKVQFVAKDGSMSSEVAGEAAMLVKVDYARDRAWAVLHGRGLATTGPGESIWHPARVAGASWLPPLPEDLDYSNLCFGATLFAFTADRTVYVGEPDGDRLLVTHAYDLARDILSIAFNAADSDVIVATLGDPTRPRVWIWDATTREGMLGPALRAMPAAVHYDATRHRLMAVSRSRIEVVGMDGRHLARLVVTLDHGPRTVNWAWQRLALVVDLPVAMLTILTPFGVVMEAVGLAHPFSR